MHVEHVLFDRVFDVQPGRGEFSFSSGTQQRFGVQLRAGALPHAGSDYLFALASADDWARPLGWMDRHSKTIALRDASWLTVLSVLTSAIWWSPFLLVGALLLGGAYAALAALVAIIAASAWTLQRHLGQQQQIRLALQEADRIG